MKTNVINNWQDTLLKNLKWKTPKITYTDDGKIDFDIHLPLTEMLERQAKRSYLNGMMTVINFFSDTATKSKPITQEGLKHLFEQAGFPEVSSQIKHNK